MALGNLGEYLLARLDTGFYYICSRAREFFLITYTPFDVKFIMVEHNKGSLVMFETVEYIEPPPTIYNPSWVASGNMINMILESERRFFLSPRTISKSLPDSSIISIAIIFVTCKYLDVTERKSTFGLHVEDVMSVD